MDELDRFEARRQFIGYCILFGSLVAGVDAVVRALLGHPRIDLGIIVGIFIGRGLLLRREHHRQLAQAGALITVVITLLLTALFLGGYGTPRVLDYELSPSPWYALITVLIGAFAGWVAVQLEQPEMKAIFTTAPSPSDQMWRPVALACIVAMLPLSLSEYFIGSVVKVIESKVQDARCFDITIRGVDAVSGDAIAIEKLVPIQFPATKERTLTPIEVFHDFTDGVPTLHAAWIGGPVTVELYRRGYRSRRMALGMDSERGDLRVPLERAN